MCDLRLEPSVNIDDQNCDKKIQFSYITQLQSYMYVYWIPKPFFSFPWKLIHFFCISDCLKNIPGKAGEPILEKLYSFARKLNHTDRCYWAISMCFEYTCWVCFFYQINSHTHTLAQTYTHIIGRNNLNNVSQNNNEFGNPPWGWSAHG